ncbi:hypothetical protein ACGFXC_36590 [Streptomyces sp. NPDC048507]|uniref:hypothetical protein n=1 Tax=Streptomyces sp. NPDC048507 TaxID=3365560 RepID=UPI00371A2CAB
MDRATSYIVGPELFAELGLKAAALVAVLALLLALSSARNALRKRRALRIAEEAEAARRAEREEEERRRQAEWAARPKPAPEPDPRRDPAWPELVYDHVLKELLKKPGDSSRISRLSKDVPAYLSLDEIDRALDRAVREGIALFDHDRQHWRLTRRGSRIFEEFAGDRKRMDETENRRDQPRVTIDARGAGNVAHTVHGGISGTTVHNAAPGASAPPGEVDLAAVLELLEQLRSALLGAEGLSELARERAAGDLGEVARELRAPEEEREPGRIRAALERLRVTFVGVDGLIVVVNQIGDHLRGWLSP